MKFNIGQKVKIVSTGDIGEVWATSGSVVYVCVPDVSSQTVKMLYEEEVEELSTV